MGSSRSHGDTRKMAEAVAGHLGCEIVDLRDYDISYYDYEHNNLNDDFFPVIEKITQYDNLIFATPVYWFSMSAIMKTFFDRFSDLLHERKDLGYRMKKKNMYLVTNSSTAILTRHFEVPFIDTAGYMGMNYMGNVHGYVRNGEIPDDVKDDIAKFANTILKKV